ncbi:MAG TPA: hypothetical protein VGD08_08120 [Stellaceae bacterium]|jgi:hypothetical protein
MPKTANTGSDRETGRSTKDGGHARREIHDEGAPAASGQDMPRDEESAGEPAVSPADGVLDPSVNESSRH